MTYLKVWVSFREALKEYSDAEKGRLFDAMLAYAADGEEPHFTGNERFIWATVKQNIDMTRETSEKRKVTGAMGGTASQEANESKDKQTVANYSKDNQEEAKGSYKDKEKKSNDKETFINDDNARAIQGEHDRLMDAADDAGFIRSNSTRAALIRLYAQYGLDRVLEGISSCVKHGAPNLAYLEAVLKGAPKKEKPKVGAQNYDQRDYSGVQDDLLRRQSDRIAERLQQAGKAI